MNIDALVLGALLLGGWALVGESRASEKPNIIVILYVALPRVEADFTISMDGPVDDCA